MGVLSDYSAIFIKIFFKRKRKNPKKLTTNLDWNLFLEDETKEKNNIDLKDSFQKNAFIEESKDITFESFIKLLIYSAKTFDHQMNLH